MQIPYSMFLKFSLFIFNIIFCTNLLAVEVNKGQQIIAFDPYWKFNIDPNSEGLEKKWHTSSFNDAAWTMMSVPGNWDLYNEYANYKGTAWYRTSFKTPLVKNKQIILSLGEVGMSYKIFLNGKQLADILCGNYMEQFDVTKLLKAGINNVLSVQIDNSLNYGAYWSWGGFRRPVSLLVREPVFIEQQQITSDPDLFNGTANVSTKVFLKNETNVDKVISLKQQISLNGVALTYSSPESIKLAAHTEKVYVFNRPLSKSQVKLWHFDHPTLYKSTVTLQDQNGIVFQQTSRFGIRKIEIDGLRFLLNGESVRLAGYNWVADDRTTGNTLPEFRFKEDIDLMKTAGANMARISHRPLPDDVMDYLDEKGILVLAEFNNWPPYMNAESEEPKIFAKKLVEQNFNHPSIFGWSIGNENGSLKDFPKVNEYFSSIIDYIKKIDRNRFVTYVSHTADFQDNDAVKFCDLIMMNKYGNFEKAVDNLKIRYPNKIVFLSEYGAHADNLIYDTPNNSTFKSLMVDNLRSKENLIGYSIWTFNDYRSSYQTPVPSVSTPLHQHRQWGVVDVYRNKKRAYRQMQNFYAPISDLQLSINTLTGQKMQSDIVLVPRKKMDIPAYELKGYQLVWELRNSKNENSSMGTIPLDHILPGTESKFYQVKFKRSDSDMFFKLSLLSPTGYVVKDTTHFFAPPPAPSKIQLLTGTKEARLIFEKSPMATEYQVKYRVVDSVETEMKPTIDHYTDITNLVMGKTYEFWVVAKNGFGESARSEIKTYTPKPGYMLLPPIIWLSEPGDHSFFVGYSFYWSDASYEVRYGTDLTKKENWKTNRTTNFSMIQVPKLENGKTYYYQLRKLSLYYGSVNEWSEIKQVIPNAGHQFGTISIQGFKQTANELVVSFSGAKNAKGYNIICNVKNKKKAYYVNQSISGLTKLILEDDSVVESLEIFAN